MAQASFLEISEANHTRLVEYIDGLRAARLKFPGRLGKVNKTAVARACNFSREVFQQNPRFARTLDSGVEELGVDQPEVDEPVQRDSGDKARILRLEQQLAAARSENHELRRRLRRYETIVDHMAISGRRVLP